MRFLIDNNLSPRLVQHLNAAGHDSTHVRDYGLQAATDPVVLAREKAVSPSILLIRRLAGRRAAEQADVILANLDAVAGDLEAGAVVVLTDEWIRVRRLPIGS